MLGLESTTFWPFVAALTRWNSAHDVPVARRPEGRTKGKEEDMLRRKGIVMGLLTGLLGLGLALSACKAGVPQQDFDAVKQQLSAKEQEVAKLRQDLQAAGAGGQQGTALQQQLSRQEKELAA